MPPYGAVPQGDEGLYWGRIGQAPERLSELVPSAMPALDGEGRRLVAAFVEEDLTTIEIYNVIADRGALGPIGHDRRLSATARLARKWGGGAGGRGRTWVRQRVFDLRYAS